MNFTTMHQMSKYVIIDSFRKIRQSIKKFLYVMKVYRIILFIKYNNCIVHRFSNDYITNFSILNFTDSNLKALQKPKI